MFKFLHLLINSTFKYAMGVLLTLRICSGSTVSGAEPLTLTLTNSLVYGIRYNDNNSAAASPRSEQISAERISQLSQSSQERTNRLPQAISKAILRDAQKRSGVPIHDLQITQAIPKTFSNPCIFKFGEICTREYNPIVGWEVIVQVQKESWTYHVDKSGSQIVLDPKLK